MRQIFLRGENVNLVVLEKRDVPVLAAGMNDQNTTRFLKRGSYPMTEEMEETWVDTLYPSEKRLTLGIWHTTREKLIGTVGLDTDHQNQHATLGIAIYAHDLRGVGIGTESIQLILKHAFTRLNIKTVKLDVISNNPRAIRCYEKCGFVEVGRVPNWFFREGSWHDEVIMAAFRDP